jgi:IS5 family transposase
MSRAYCVIVGAKNFSHNEYDGDPLESVLSQVKDMRGVVPKTAYCDCGFRGRKRVGETSIVLPDVPPTSRTEHAKRKARKNFCRRSAIEPVIGHMKNDFRLVRNYLKGTIGDAINLLLAAAAFNCKKWMNAVRSGLFFVLLAFWVAMRRKDEWQFAPA